MFRLVVYTLIAAFVLPAAVAAQEDADTQNAFWQNEYCINPTVPYMARLKPNTGEVSVLFDVSAIGKVGNVRTVNAVSPGGERFTKAFARSVRQALRRWEYFAYINDGVEAPRSDVSLTFNFVEHGTDVRALSDDQKCVTSVLPERPSHAGDPADAVVNLARCVPPNMPRRADKAKKSGQVTVTFDVTKKGKPIRLALADGQAENSFTKEALRVLKQWRYTPFLKAGEPVERHHLTMDFTFGEDLAGASEFSCSYAAFGSSRSLSAIGTSDTCEIRYNDGIPAPSKGCFK